MPTWFSIDNFNGFTLAYAKEPNLAYVNAHGKYDWCP